MREKAVFRTVSRVGYLSLAVLLSLVLTGSIWPQAHQGEEAQAQVLGPAAVLARAPGQPGTGVCSAAADNVIFLPLVARDYSGSASPAFVQPGPGSAAASQAVGLRLVASPADGSVGLRVAYVHGADTTTAGEFWSLLNARGFQTYLLPLADLTDADFSGCDLILVGSDTGTWQDQAEVEAVLNAGLPVGAIGGGGFRFLGSAGLLEGLTSGSGSGTTVEATLRGREAYLFPSTIPLASDDSVQVYTAASSARWLDLPEPLPDGIEIGRLPGTTQVPIVQLGGWFLLWGFSAGPEGMTQAGQDLFVNTLTFQGQANSVPLRTRRFIPEPGIEQAFLDELAGTEADRLHAFIQLRVPAGDAACDDLANLVPVGVRELYPLYGLTHAAFVAKSFNPSDALVAACLRWVGRILPEDKVMPKVLAGNFETWADNGDGTVNLLVRFFPDASDGDATSVLTPYVVSQTKHSMKTWAVVMAKTQISPLSQSDPVRWIQEGPSPTPLENDIARQELFVDDVQDATISGGSITYNGLDGSGIQVAIMDEPVDDTHPDFTGRMIRTRSSPYSNHGTHVAGIVGASGASSLGEGGTDFQWRGMAPGVELAAYGQSYDDTGDFNEAYNTLGVDISNHSYAMTCQSYDAQQANVDSIIRGDADDGGTSIPARPYHKSAGNGGTNGQYCAGRGYFSPTGVAKNITIVGALNPSTDYALRPISSRGPTFDGRIKPDVMAIGYMKSTFVNDGGPLYEYAGGTSMASPATVGVAALALEQYGLTYGTTHPLPSTVRGLLINNATDLVHDPADASYVAYGWDDPDTGEPVIFHQGPDFSTGYGVVHARRTVDAVRHRDVIEDELANDADTDEFTFDVLADREELRFTLAWDDPAADSALDEDVSHLVNDLDLELVDPNGGLHYPWVLTPLTPNDAFDGSDDPIDTVDITAAYPAVDHRNNVEQVVVWAGDVDPADWAGTWTARVRATDMPDAPQAYSLVGEWREITLQDIYPLVAGYHLAPDKVIIPVRVRNPYASPTAAAGGITAVNWEVRIGDSASDTWTEATVEAAWGPVSDLAYLVVRPPDTLAAGILYDIEVTLLDVYQVDQRVAEAYEPVDRATRADAVFFLAEPRAPVDEVILMDNSGSMGDYGKLDSAKNAARAFADRRQEGDMIGLTRFANLAITLYDLTAVSAGETELEDVKIQIDNMIELDNTGIGPGMLEGKNQLDVRGNPTHTWGIVLLSDGNENIPPCWDTGPGNPKCEGQASVQPDFVPVGGGCPAIHVDTVAIGPEFAVWRDTLQDIAEKTCGDVWDATVEGGTGAAATARATWAEGALPEGKPASTQIFPESLPNTLADIYVSIADGNSQQQRLWEEVGTLAQGEKIQRTIRLETGLAEATFAVNWPDAAYPFAVKLYRPTGVVVDPADADAHYKADATHDVYRLEAPGKGDWTLEIGWKHAEEGNEYLAVVSGNSDVTMLLGLGLPPPERVVGAEMPIYVVLVDEGGPITGANVQLAIRRPGGGIDSLIMHDNSSHGDQAADDGVYTNEYAIPEVGNYEVKARGEGTAHDGEPFLRYRLEHFRVSREQRAVYVVAKDTDTANAYKALLDGNGLVVTIVDLDDVETTDLSRFDLVIIGPDTGEEATWGDVGKVAHIRDSGKPVLGLGDGGYAFFGKLGLNIGHNHGASATDADVEAVDGSHDIWNQPYDIVLGSEDPVVTVYARTGSPGVVVYLPGTPPDVEKIGQRPAAGELYWLAREGSRYLLWGFNLGPGAMTDEGKEVFVNTAWYAFP